MKLKYKIFRYGLLRRLKKGRRLYIFTTLRCNLNCSYCTNKFVHGVTPTYDELTFEQWKDIIDNLDFKVNEVFVTGGEPFLYSDLDKLLHYLLRKKYMVTVFTNLSKLILSKSMITLPFPSVKLRFVATHHKDIYSIQHDIFKMNYTYMIAHGYNVLVDRFDDVLNIGRKKDIISETIDMHQCLHDTMTGFAPDGTRIFTRYGLLTGGK